MRTKNFFKSLAVAAVALVGVFATSCSEEDLQISNKPVNPSEPTELPDGVAYYVASVVDLGDLGTSAKILATKVEKVSTGEVSVECPDFEGKEEYIIPAAQKINVPTLVKGQTLSIPLTFYVVKTTSAFADVKFDPNDAIDWGNNPETGDFYTYSTKLYSGNEQQADATYDEDLKNVTDYWKSISFRYSIPLAYFTQALNYSTTNPFARVAETTAEEIIKAYIENMISDPEMNPTDERYLMTAGPVEVYSYGYVDVNVVTYSSHPTYAVEYNGETIYVTLEQITYKSAYISEQKALPGHEHANSHSHSHGGYPNAGGGVTVWE